MEELLEDLSLSRSSSIEDVHGFQLIDGVPLTPPLAPKTNPTSPPPALLASPESSRTTHTWSADELELVVGLFYRWGPKYRTIARHVAGRSEDAVRQFLKRRGMIAPQSSPVRRRRSSKAPRWTRSEDRRLLKAFEAVPRHQSGSVSWSQVQAAAGLGRPPHSLRNRWARLAAMGA